MAILNSVSYLPSLILPKKAETLRRPNNTLRLVLFSFSQLTSTIRYELQHPSVTGSNYGDRICPKFRPYFYTNIEINKPLKLKYIIETDM
jgi:hypothetical protein